MCFNPHCRSLFRSQVFKCLLGFYATWIGFLPQNNDLSNFPDPCGTGLHLYLTSWEGLILHDDGAAAGQDHDVQLLLLVVSLLVPLPHHVCVVGWNQSDLTQDKEKEHPYKTKSILS